MNSCNLFIVGSSNPCNLLNTFKNEQIAAKLGSFAHEVSPSDAIVVTQKAFSLRITNGSLNGNRILSLIKNITLENMHMIHEINFMLCKESFLLLQNSKIQLDDSHGSIHRH